MHLKTLLTSATHILHPASKTPVLDAEILLAHVLQKPRIFLHTWPLYEVDKHIPETFFHLVEKRRAGWPIAYLTGEQPFYSLNLKVNESTLIPEPKQNI